MTDSNITPSSSSGSSDHGVGSPVQLGASAPGMQPTEPTGLDPDPESSRTGTERHPKGKRKRTAAKDKSILEAAYLLNPKPDKAARLDIVQRVSLSEKEVQIWFQNRRQNDRRKSRPLSPQEIAALRYGGMQILSSDSAQFCSHRLGEPSSSPSEPTLSLARRSSQTPQQELPATPSPLDPGVVEDDGLQQETTDRSDSDSVLASSQETNSALHSMSVSFSSSIGYLSNRRNLGSSFSANSVPIHDGDESLRIETLPQLSCSPNAAMNTVLPPPSHFRLSLSLEGKAELVSNEVSPPRNQAPKPSEAPNAPTTARLRGLYRSHSAQPSMTLPPISTLTESLPPTLSRGKSRDAHAWEMCCDADARDELTAQAEDESNGSATAAISLLRSASNILSANSSKRNSPASKPTPRSGNPKKPKLARASSCTTCSHTSAAPDADPKPPKYEQQAPRAGKLRVDMLLSPSGDSDKENWSPDSNGKPRQHHGELTARRPLPEASHRPTNRRRTGRVLEESYSTSLLSSARANTAPARDVGKWQHLEIFEDADSRPLPKLGEVEKFMQGEVSPSKKGDMDCVAGLLSLSQGNWR